MNHSFDCEVAAQYGLLEAILINNFQHWIKLNRDNNRNFKDGRTWTYNSVKGFHKQYFYVSADKIRRALDKLVAEQIIVKGVYNERPGDRTTWYAFTDEEYWVPEPDHLASVPSGRVDSAKSPFGTGANSTNKTDINAVVTTSTAPSAQSVKFSPLVFLIAQGVDRQVATDWLAVCKGLRKVVTQTKLDDFQTEITRAGMTWDATIRLCCSRNWVSFNADWAGDRRSTGRALAPASSPQSGMSAKTAATVANLNAYFGEN